MIKWLFVAGLALMGCIIAVSMLCNRSSETIDEPCVSKPVAAAPPLPVSTESARAPAQGAQEDASQQQTSGELAVADNSVDARGVAEDAHTGLQKRLDYGSMPVIDPHKHPQAASVVAALSGRSQPERLSPIVPPKPFDAVAYQKNPAEYLSVSEPGRVFQVAQPGKGVNPLRRISGRLHRVNQGESVSLKVHGQPGAPISFTTFDGGRFVENTLPAITVQANDEGVVTVEYEATSGVINNVAILAGSPTCSGQLRFSIVVERPGHASPLARSK